MWFLARMLADLIHKCFPAHIFANYMFYECFLFVCVFVCLIVLKLFPIDEGKQPFTVRTRHWQTVMHVCDV